MFPVSCKKGALVLAGDAAYGSQALKPVYNQALI